MEKRQEVEILKKALKEDYKLTLSAKEVDEANGNLLRVFELLVKFDEKDSLSEVRKSS